MKVSSKQLVADPVRLSVSKSDNNMMMQMINKTKASWGQTKIEG